MSDLVRTPVAGWPRLSHLPLGPQGDAYVRLCKHHGSHARWSIRKPANRGPRAICLLCEAERCAGGARMAYKNRFRKRMAAQGLFRCGVCKIEDPQWSFFDVDHIVPRSQGGGNVASNLQLICPNCHRRKCLAEGTMTPADGGWLVCAKEDYRAA